MNDGRDEKRDTLNLPEVIQRKTPEIRLAELGNATAFRIKLDPPLPGTADQQAELINALRGVDHPESPWMVAYPDGQDSVFGYFWSSEQLQQFKTIAAQYRGVCGFGASLGESRIMLSIDEDHEKGRDAWIWTSQATNAAARIVSAPQGAIRTETLATGEELFAYQYYDEAIDGPTSETTLVIGAKATSLRKIPLDEEFAKMWGDAQTIAKNSEAVLQLPGIRDRVDFETTVLQDQAELAIISVDINGMSKRVHTLATQLRGLPPEQQQEKQKEITDYLKTIASFFTTLEARVRQLIIEDQGHGSNIHFPDWRGDAGGMIVSNKYRQHLIDAFDTVIPLFPDIEVKAFIKSYKELTLKTAKGRAFQDEKFAEEEATFGAFVKKKLNNSTIYTSGLLIIDESNEEMPAQLHKYDKKRGWKTEWIGTENWKTLVEEMNGKRNRN